MAGSGPTSIGQGSAGPRGAGLAAVPWEPPALISREEIVATSEAVLALPQIPFTENEKILRIRSLGLDWDVGIMVYEPKNAGAIPVGPDGSKTGIFVLHGGAGDYRSMEPLARLLVSKFGCKIASMTYPGRLNLADRHRDWPGDTIHPDGSVRTPIWKEGETITRDQYEVIEDISMRARYGTRILARAKKGTPFYDRMAAWPAAFEDAMKEVCRAEFPQQSFTIYVHGHSTGGPFVHMLTQRLANIGGVIGIENSPFGYIYQALVDIEWQGPFTDVQIRTWRDLARYKGAEVLSAEGPDGLMRLPWLMEEIMEAWEKQKSRPQFKAEYIVHYNSVPALTEAARAAAGRLGLNGDDTEALVARYLGYGRELTGPSVKPVPPLLLAIAKRSRDHRAEIYDRVVAPMFAAMTPAPKLRIVRFDAGTHSYASPEPDLPMGLAPAAAKLWTDAIRAGYYAV